MPSQDSSRDYDLLDRLVEEFNDRLRKGQRPSLQEYCDRHPDLADDLRDLLPALAQLEQAKDGLAQEAEAAPAAPALQHLGDFRILREVGHGGMGVVYEAEQLSLGRRVALKVLTDRLMREDRQKRRFEREARAAARLHHTNIVPVFGTGEAEGVPYYVMQFIQGMGLDAVVEELRRLSPGSGPMPPPADSPAAPRTQPARRVARSLLSGEFAGAEEGATQAHVAAPAGPDPAAPPAAEPARPGDTSGGSSGVTLPGQNPGAGGRGRPLSYFQSVARIGVQVADALDYAHRQGVVHRDVKPSNLLLDLDGAVWVTDFGLAKAEGGENLTHTGDILGTLRYMPPEAFDGKADARGDVYSLGLTLYELVALRPAFDQRDRNHLVKQVTTAEIPPLGTLRRGVPRDLETIVHKAIDRDPARRYQTAGGLRDDLQRFVDDEPILARRQTLTERYVRWARRHPAVAVLGAALAAVLLLATAGSLVVAGRMSALAQSEALAAQEERAARKEAEEGKAREAALRRQAEQAEAREAKLRGQAEANFAKAQAAVDDYFTRVSENRLLQVPGLKGLRKDLLLSALAFYQGFLRDRAGDPTVRTGLAGAYLRVGKIRTELGEHPEARSAYEQAFRLYTELLRANPTDVEARHGLASCHSGLGRYAEAAALWEDLVRPAGDRRVARFQRDLAETYNALAVSHATDPTKDAALAYHRKALAVRERLLARDPLDPDHLADLAQSLNNIGVTLSQMDRHAEALTLYRRAAGNMELAYRLSPANTRLARGVAIAQSNIARMESSLGNTEAAVAARRRAAEVRRWMVRDNPAVPTFQADYVGDSEQLAALLLRQKRPDEALRAAREARETLENLRDDSPAHLLSLARARVLHANTLKEARADPSPAEQTEYRHAMDAAAAALKQAVAADARSALGLAAMPQFKALLERADVKAPLARAAELARAEDTARDPSAKNQDRLPAAQKVYRAKEELVRADPSNRRVRADLAAAQQAVGLIQANLNQLDEARLSLEKALSLRQALAGERPEDAQARAELSSAQTALADLHWKADRLADWRRLSRQGLASLQEAARLSPPGPPDKRPGAAHLVLADRYAELGLWAEAAAEMRTALARVGYDAHHHEVDLYLHAGLLFLLAGDVEGYRTCAKEGLRLRGDTDDPVQAHRLLYLLAQAPDAPGDADQRTRLAAVANKKGSAPWVAWWGTASRGISEYQAGKAAQAMDRLAASTRAARSDFDRTIAGVFLALALHQLDRPAEARAALNGPTRRIDADARAAAAAGRIPRPFAWAHYLSPYREASRVVLGRADPHGPYLRLLRARSYALLGEPALAEKEFAAAVAARPRDPDVLAVRAQAYAALGQKERAAADLAEGRKQTDRLLAGPIETSQEAGRVAGYLLALADDPATVLKPTRLKSEGGARFTVLPDGSVLVGGANPNKEAYTFEADLAAGPFTCLRLEALTHPSLVNNGPGRAHNGNFNLTEISLAAGPAGGKRPAAAVPFVWADASYALDASTASAAVDGKTETWWDVWPRVGQAHTAWFELAKPVGRRTRLTIRMDFRNFNQHTLGRFRLSLLAAPPVRRAATARLGARSLDPFGGYARLAAVLAASGRRPEVAARMFAQALGGEKTPGNLRAVRKAAAHDAAVFAELVKLRPKDPELWAARGRRLQAAGKKQEADEAFARAAGLTPKE
jgi:serine/threonine-protein kinase